MDVGWDVSCVWMVLGPLCYPSTLGLRSWGVGGIRGTWILSRGVVDEHLLPSGLWFSLGESI